MITDRELRLVYAPRGETSGWLAFPLRSLATVAGRPMLAGLKLALGGFRLFNAPAGQRLPALLKQSREAQAAVSTALAGLRPPERAKHLREACHRGGIPGGVEKAVKAASDAGAMAAALEAIVDERGSPGRSPLGAGTPILQPTEERRRTGSHYTPRALTEPIVRRALKPPLDRLGPDARPAAILDLKVCDPAMGSGAFLVEACRHLAERLTQAWARWPETRPQIPADEDEELHARRLIAQRCLYGVDRNPMAADLGRLSLWLATLARDHEFTFLDHAIKSGDSLVGLDVKQIEALHWDGAQADVDPGLMRGLVKARLEKVDAERRRIREAVEAATEDDLRPILKRAEKPLEDPKLIGDAVLAAFFSGTKPKAREAARVKVRAAIEMGGPDWRERLKALTPTLSRTREREQAAHAQPLARLREREGPAQREGEGPLPLPLAGEGWGEGVAGRGEGSQITPFHWPVEFPEVFDRANPGFTARPAGSIASAPSSRCRCG